MDRSGEQNETFATCVLDFYVHESRQRSGCGRKLFEHMLGDQGIAQPSYMAIDRPSPKLLGFLKKYYGLAAPIPQVSRALLLSFWGLSEHMLGDQGIAQPAYIAIDRPSPKLLAFLKKYCELAAPIPQAS